MDRRDDECPSRKDICRIGPARRAQFAAAPDLTGDASGGRELALRLRAESQSAGGIDILEEAAKKLEDMADPPTSAPVGPMMPVSYRSGDQRLSMFGTIAQFSTVTDATLDDLKIELFFPADTEREAALTSLFGSTPTV